LIYVGMQGIKELHNIFGLSKSVCTKRIWC
jgi:hypothetical protein